jgi:hypothetical protein
MLPYTKIILKNATLKECRVSLWMKWSPEQNNHKVGANQVICLIMAILEMKGLTKHE